MTTYQFNGMIIELFSKLPDLDPRYVRASRIFNAKNVARDFVKGMPVPDGMCVIFQGRRYRSGETMPSRPGEALAAVEAQGDAAPSQSPAKAPVSAPTLDMFDNTDPNAPRTTDQNNAFWGLMEQLGKLTGKTGEEMKTVVVARALGENKGTSKLTIAEMEKVIRFVKDTIALFEQHDWATAGKEKEA